MQSVTEWRSATAWDINDAERQDLLAAKSGDRDAADRLLRPHQRSLYSLCRGMVASADDAEDAVQETFFRALRALPRFQDRSHLRTWLYRIALNVCLEWRRSRR